MDVKRIELTSLTARMNEYMTTFKKKKDQYKDSSSYVSGCFNVVGKYMNHDQISLPIEGTEQRGIKIDDDTNLYLVVDLSGNVSASTMATNQKLKHLSVDDIINKYGANKFGSLIYDAIGKMKEHDDKIVEQDEHIHEAGKALRENK